MTTYLKLVKGATKIKMAPPKQKYIDPILLGTSQQQDFQEIVRALGPRINDSAFTIAYKSLIVIHLMMREGDRDVAIRYFSRDLEFFNVSNASRSGNGRFESHALERYNSYLKERCQEFSITQIDYVRDGYSSLRSIINDRHNNSINKALNHVESLETQITSLLKNKYSIGDLSNDLLLFAFKLLVFDLLALYNALNEGIITLLESFFELSHNNAERTLDLYKNFVDLTESVVRYLKTGKAVGLKIPVIKHITTKLVRSLEEHLREDNITHNTFNDENNNGNGNNNNNLAVDSPSKGLAQKRLDEIREQKRQLQEQLSHPQLLINSTGSNNPMMMQQATTLPQMNLQQLPQQQVVQPQMAPQMTANNPFMNQMHTQQQVPQQANIQPQVPPNNLQYTNTAPIMMTQNDIMQQQQQQQQMLQQQIPQQVPQQQAPQLNMSMTLPSLPEQPLPTGNNNPFSVNNVNATQQIQEQNNPFSQTNYQQPLQQATTLQSTSTNNNSNNNFMQGNVTTATASTSNNPFALPGQPQQSQPQSHALQTAMTAPVSMNQTVPQYNQPFAQQAPQQYMQQQQQQQPFMQQPQQQQEINLIDF